MSGGASRFGLWQQAGTIEAALPAVAPAWPMRPVCAEQGQGVEITIAVWASLHRSAH
jgi:hypothetical protein